MTHLALTVFGFNTTARALYDKLGYTVAATIMMKRIGEDDWRLPESAAAPSHWAIRRQWRPRIGYNAGVCAAHDASTWPGGVGMTTSVGERVRTKGAVGWIRRFGLTRGAALVTLVIANALWAGTYAAGKVALRDLNPIELNALRFLIASIILAPALIRGWRSIPRDRSSLATLAMLTLLGFVLNKAFEYFGLELSTASDVALLIATESLFTAVLSWTLLRERVTAAGVAALVVGMAGVYLIVERGFIPNLGGPEGSGRVIGDLLVIFSLLLESGYTILGKRTLTQLPPLLFTAATLTGSLFVWIPAGIGSVARLGLPHLTLAGWIGVIYMALIATVLGYWLWFRALSVVDASTAAPTLFIQPLLGAALGVWLLHDSVTWATWLGGGLIFASLLLVMRRDHAHRNGADIGETLVELGESAP